MAVADNRKQLSATFWTTVIMVAALVAYPLSVGPATWLIAALPNSLVPRYVAAYFAIYRPLFCLSDHCAALDRFLGWYAGGLFEV